MYYLEPYKTRTYAILSEDMESTSFRLDFDCGQFFSIAEENAIYLYANFTKVSPIPTTKFKPEAFIWQTPTPAVIIFHYNSYQINTKNGDKWEKITKEPAAVEKFLANYIYQAGGFIGVPLIGSIDYSNSSLVAAMLSGEDPKARIQALNSILQLRTLEAPIDGFSPPDFGKSKSGNSSSYGGYGAKKANELTSEKHAFYLSFLSSYLEIKEETSPAKEQEVVRTMAALKENLPHEYTVLMDFLRLSNR